ncbi:hypothetical protein N9A89_03850 [Akkermansiaceae bacterium]|nr:hypothetical protein [Akkermansiaceae bacterium]MDB4277234.1 hypothetical protein [bacterium]MDA7683968.1 hypothetical protein [Akkermansiaceae bacterium]MDA7863692.1 hypothetical protein [Akkermansiaceae bacterium]MDA7877183.1 hypothetical protein [Akkermansiaceae bacterium]
MRWCLQSRLTFVHQKHHRDYEAYGGHERDGGVRLPFGNFLV